MAEPEKDCKVNDMSEIGIPKSFKEIVQIFLSIGMSEIAENI